MATLLWKHRKTTKTKLLFLIAECISLLFGVLKCIKTLHNFMTRQNVATGIEKTEDYTNARKGDTVYHND